MNQSHTMSMPHARHESKAHTMSHYQKLFLISLGHFVIMFAVMYTMVASARDIFVNLNNLYMTGMMLAPMVLLMPLTMSMMYPNKKINLFIYSGAAIAFIGFFAFMRSQSFIDDKAFVRSMIPHHSGAILMCNEAQINDPELKALCSQIVTGQRSEIEQMRKILDRL
jgi:hypothetical protein